MANPTVMGGASAPSTQGLDLSNPNILNMIKAMQLAQYQGNQGEAMQEQGDNSPTGTQFVPAANAYAPARAIKQSPLVPLAGAAEKMTGTYMQKQAMQQQIALAMAMQQTRDSQKFGMGGASAQASGGPLAAAMQPQGTPNSSGAPPAPSAAAGTPLPPPLGQTQAGGFNPQAAAMLSPKPVPASVPAIGTGGPGEAPMAPMVASNSPPPIVGGLDGNTPSAPMPSAPPAQSANPNVPNGMTPDQARALSYSNPEQYQKLLDAQVSTQAKNAELTPEQKNIAGGTAQKEATQQDVGKNTAEALKAYMAINGAAPNVIDRLNKLRANIPDASSGAFVNEDGSGASPELSQTLGTKTATANANLRSLAAQGVMPEISNALANSNMKGNKFMEGIIANGNSLNMADPADAKFSTVNNLQGNYVGNYKAAAKVLRENGMKTLPDGTPIISDNDIDKMFPSIKTATNPKTGEKMNYNGNAWFSPQ